MAILSFLAFSPSATRAAGLTLITHGYDGDTTGWITAMASQIPSYFQAGHPGSSTNVTIYTVTLTTDGNNYFYQWHRDAGSSPTNTDTGEIVVKLDWSQMAGSPDPFSSAYDISTYKVAAVASAVLLQTNTIAELNGHALAEFPIHLIGHSRGGSLISQISLILGTNGVWVDHLTTLDPHPFNNDGNFDFGFPTDAPVRTYQNVTFADNYWQDLGTFPDQTGEAVAGAYVRQLDAEELTGGYNGIDIAPDHANVHLWYYGTINLNTPVTFDDDGETVPINAVMRQNWWVPYEEAGTNADFRYSLIGGGNRLSTDRPLGLPSDPAIVNGYNQNWNLGAGSAGNRTALPSNNGSWPNLIKFDITGTNSVTQNTPIITTLYYQYGGASNLTLQVSLDEDFNPYNSNSIPLLTVQPPSSGIGSVNVYSTLALSTTNVPAGIYAVYAKISDGKHTRYLYTPGLVQITSPVTPPFLGIQKSGANQFMIAINGASGEKLILQTSSNLKQWTSIATNTLTTSAWNYTNSVSVSPQFYRAILAQ